MCLLLCRSLAQQLHADWFLVDPLFLQTYDKLRNALALSTSPVVRALIDPEGAMRDIRELDKVCFGNVALLLSMIVWFSSGIV